MKFLSLTARDCQHLRSFINSVQSMLNDYDLALKDEDYSIFDKAIFDPAYKTYRKIISALCEAGTKLNDLEDLLHDAERKEMAS